MKEIERKLKAGEKLTPEEAAVVPYELRTKIYGREIFKRWERAHAEISLMYTTDVKKYIRTLEGIICDFKVLIEGGAVIAEGVGIQTLEDLFAPKKFDKTSEEEDMG